MIIMTVINYNIMDINDLRKIISEMKTGKLGSFGEYIIVKTLTEKGHKITGKHGASKDFNTDGVRTDVKSHRNMNLTSSPKRRYPNPEPDTDYIHLFFLANEIGYYEEEEKYRGNISYEKAIEYYKEWSQNRKNDASYEPTLRRKREEIKIRFRKETTSELGYPIYVVQRGREILGKGGFQQGPDNLSLVSIRHGERLMIYLEFSRNSTDFGRGTAFTVEDVKARKLPMTYAWRPPHNEIVVTEEKATGYTKNGSISGELTGMWAFKEKYPSALFAEGVSLERFRHKIVEKFKHS
jgi:hypothetical protein